MGPACGAVSKASSPSPPSARARVRASVCLSAHGNVGSQRMRTSARTSARPSKHASVRTHLCVTLSAAGVCMPACVRSVSIPADIQTGNRGDVCGTVDRGVGGKMVMKD
ncbi:hypothetical protein AAFF_G00254300 [Aldrovandia affinis]|uniref:Uncharacterized protein n=1 Tax=Aldrovandia affinis TaxID=143900 RepID=A0AAD7RCK0_9TELE|nr:hypothetical protein AAFF_G00254300 [Aldrovandia affinis]